MVRHSLLFSVSSSPAAFSPVSCSQRFLIISQYHGLCMPAKRKPPMQLIHQMHRRSCYYGGTTRNRTGDQGFADPCLTAWLWCHRKTGASMLLFSFFGAEDEARTRYLHLGKVALYQMSYSRRTSQKCEVVPPIGIEPMTRGFSVPCSTN